MERMGAFRVPIEIASLTGRRFEGLEALVDTGASHLCIPRDRLEAIGVEPEEQWPFTRADGREVDFDVGSLLIRIGGRTRPTIVVFGEPGSDALLGAHTLEGFRLAVDPVSQRLLPIPGLLKQLAA